MSTKNLTLEKLICPICRGILIEPVTMPCSHVLCLACFDGSMEMASLTCPLCRKRVGGWLRTAKKLNKLVNTELWSYIQRNYADYIKAKELGEDDAIEDVLEGTAPPPVQLSQPGEIRKEFESVQANLEREFRAKQEAELKASEDLIRQLQEEERERTERELEDERLARELQETLQHEAAAAEVETMQTEDVLNAELTSTNASTHVENKENKLGTSTNVRGPLDAFLKPLHSSRNTPQFERAKKDTLDYRCDSIAQEILHFKPINAVPLTPPKILPDGRVLEVPLIRATPVKNLLQLDSPTGSSPLLAKQLATLQVERKTATSPKKVPALKLEAGMSAFRGFHYSATECVSGKGNATVTSSSMSCANNFERTDTAMEVDTKITSGESNISSQRSSQSPDIFASDNDQSNDADISASQNSTHDKFHGFGSDQEYTDFLFAKQLQKSFDTEVNTNSDASKYQFRKRSVPSKGVTKKKTSLQRNRTLSLPAASQPTLREAFRRATTKNNKYY